MFRGLFDEPLPGVRVSQVDTNASARRLSWWWLGLGRVAVAVWAILFLLAFVGIASEGGRLDEEAAGGLLIIHGLFCLLAPYLLLPMSSQLLVAVDGDQMWVRTVLGRRRVPRPLRYVSWAWFPGARGEWQNLGVVVLRSGWRWVAVASLGDQEGVDSRLQWVVREAVRLDRTAPEPRGAGGSVGGRGLFGTVIQLAPWVVIAASFVAPILLWAVVWG